MSELMTRVSKENLTFEWKCINSVRCLSAAQPQNANSGHPGAPMALAPLAHGLWSYIMNYSPSNSAWWNRDRFVLSNGHACALQYSMLYLTGYKVTLNDLKCFRRLHSKTPGHPECTTDGVEVTTGPLGQGISNAVGMAVASTHLAAEFNKEDFDLFNSYIYCICGDGCLEEGVASESCSLAGHLGLGRLIVIYDSNRITIDGSTDLAFTEDVAARFIGYKWHVQVLSKSLDNDFQSILELLENAKSELNRPSLIIAHTTIAYGSLNQGHQKTHGAPLGIEDLKQFRKKFAIFNDPSLDDDDETFDLFRLDSDVLEYYRKCGNAGDEKEKKWRTEVWDPYKMKYPKEAEEIQRRFEGRLPENWESALPRYSSTDKGKATRVFSGIALNAVAQILPELIGGSADLTESNRTALEGEEDFLAGATPLGRYIRFGVREHGMTAMTTGIFKFGAFKPFSATFLNFVMYGWGAVRLAALSRAGTLMIATHDSIELGEDGPTHQPIEVLPILRSTPNLIPIRPADGNETSGAYRVWLMNRNRPSMIMLGRSDVPNLEGSSIENVEKGAYIISDFSGGTGKRIILAGSGTELHLVVAAKSKLKEILVDEIDIRVVSMPSWNLYSEQSENYQLSVLPQTSHRYKAHGGKIDGALFVEAASTFGWDRYFDVERSVGMTTFGESAPKNDVLKRFGFDVENITRMAEGLVENLNKI